MSIKPKYYYDLSIYDPVRTSEEEKKPNPPSEKPWHIHLGIGDWILSAISTSKTTGQKLTTKGADVLDYASTREGKVKLGVIASCTCAGGVLSLLTRPSGKLRKLLYPTAFLGLSSAICYPSSAYAIAKTTYNASVAGGTAVYNGSKFATEKVSQWRESRKIQAELDKKSVREAEMVPQEAPAKDIAPLRNAPLLDEHPADANEVTYKFEAPASTEPTEQTNDAPAEDASPAAEDSGAKTSVEFSFLQSNSLVDKSVDDVTSKMNTSQTAQDSLVDMGQSTDEDSDMYSTRSS